MANAITLKYRGGSPPGAARAAAPVGSRGPVEAHHHTSHDLAARQASSPSPQLQRRLPPSTRSAPLLAPAWLRRFAASWSCLGADGASSPASSPVAR